MHKFLALQGWREQSCNCPPHLYPCWHGESGCFMGKQKSCCCLQCSAAAVVWELASRRSSVTAF